MTKVRTWWANDEHLFDKAGGAAHDGNYGGKSYQVIAVSDILPLLKALEKIIKDGDKYYIAFNEYFPDFDPELIARQALEPFRYILSNENN